MNRFSQFLFFCLLASFTTISNAKDFNSYKAGFYDSGSPASINETAPSAVSATITGTASVCLNTSNTVITFSGSGGTAPYTFTYNIDGGADLTVSSGTGNDNATVSVNTNTPGGIIYSLTSVTDAANVTQSITGQQATVTVNALPAATFTYTDNQCSGQGVQFTPTLTGSYTYLWNFGDGSTSSDQSPIHVFNTFGSGTQTYQIKLIITDNTTSCQNTGTISISIKQTPDASLNITGGSGASNYDATQQIFTNCGATTSSPQYDFTAVNASSTSSTNTGYSIDWGDGSTVDMLPASFTTMKHRYLSLGFFDIKVTAINATTGCSGIKAYKFFNGNTPAGNLRSIPNTQDCVPYTLSWPVDGAKLNTPGTTYTFSVNDGSASQTFTQSNLPDSISHTFTSSSCSLSGNKFTVSFNVVNPCGPNLTTIMILATEKPVAKYNITPGLNACLNSPVSFTNVSTGSYSTGTTCSTVFNKIWSISPATGWTGTLSNSDNATVSFNTAGDYSVQLKIIRPNSIDSRCTSDSIIKVVHVNPLPTATISGTDSICQNGPSPLITFTGANGTAPYTFTYTLNGTTKTVKTISGNSVTVPAPTTVAGPFTYTLVSVQESSASGCSQAQTGTAVITVIPLPTAIITGTASVCLNSTSPVITFTGGKGTPPYTFTYNLNGGTNQTITTTSGNVVTIPVPTNIAGPFKYTLVSVQDADVKACSQLQTGSATITVNPTPTVNDVASQTKCNGDMSDAISFTGAIAGTVYAWTNSNPSIGLAASGTGNINSFVLKNSLATLQTATIQVTPNYTNGGTTCSGTPITFTITVKPTPTIGTQPPSNQAVCVGGTVNPLTFTYTGTGTPTFQWYQNKTNNNTGGSILLNDTSKTYTPPTGIIDTLYYYCVLTFPAGGCSNLTTNTAAVSVTPMPVITSQPTPSQSICVGGTTLTTLTVKYTGGAGNVTCQWYKNNTNTTTGGTIIPGETSLNYTPPAFAATGTFYFYAQISFAGSACGSLTSDTARVNVVSDPVVTSEPLSTQTLCQNVIPADLTVTASGGIGVYSYQWYSNIANNNSTGTKIANATGSSFTPPTSNAGTTYYYCVISQPQGPGCTVTSSTSQVIVDATPVFQTQPVSSTLCLGGTPAGLTVATKNGSGTPQYQWYSNRNDSINGGTPIPGAINPTYPPPAGTVGTTYYYCIATFSSGGCSALISNLARVTINAFPSISTYTTSVSSGNSFTVSPNTLNGDVVPVGTTYTWTVPVSNPAGSVSGATLQSTPQPVISQTLTNLTKGIATVTYTVTPTSGTCKGTAFNVVVTVNPPIYPDIVLKNITCFGANNGSIQTNITGGVPFKTGSPYLITWSGPNGFTSGNTTISNLNPGDYLLTVKDSVGVTFSKSYTILEPQVINIQTSTSKNNTCHGAANGEIAIVATGGIPPYAYSWIKDGIPFTGSADIKNLSPGNYTVTVTDTFNCLPKTASFTITEPPAIVITPFSQVNLTCFGDTNGSVSVSVAGGVPGYTYSWTGPNGFSAKTKDLTNLAAGIYTLTVTDNSGCSQTFTANVTQPAQIKITPVVTPVTCYQANDASIQLNISGGIPPYGIQWSNLAKGTIQNNLSPGTYTVTVTDSSGCKMSKDIVIAEAAFFLQPVVRQITCFGANDGSIALNIQGGSPPVKLSWSDGSPAGYTRNRLVPGTYTAYLSDASACSFIKSFTIIEPSKLKLFANITNAFDCNNPNSGAISLTVSGGTRPYSYAWTNGKTSSGLTGIQGGKYGVTVTDSLGCSVDSVFEVIEPLPITLSVNITPDFNCQTNVLNEICTAQVTGGIPPYVFNWSSGTVSGLNNETMETAQPGFIVLGVTDGKGCTASYTFNLAVPIPGIDYQIIDCNAHTFSFNAIIPNGLASDYSFLWDFGDGKTDTTQQPQHTFSASGTHKVTLTMKSPTCTSVFVENITVDATPVLTLDKLPVFCTGDSILLHVSGASTYRWSNGWTGDSLLIKLPGDYSVAGTTQHGCTVALPFKATNFDSFNYTIQTDKENVTTADPTLKLWSESISYSDYFWDFGDSQSAEGNNQSHTYDVSKDGYYDVKLKVKNPNGCYEYATKRIWITDVSIGNVFTPNGDGIDDVFMKGFHIQVYNRNGILLYDGSAGWNGTYKGSKVSNDTYFYVLYLSGASGIKTKSGFVTVVR